MVDDSNGSLAGEWLAVVMVNMLKMNDTESDSRRQVARLQVPNPFPSEDTAMMVDNGRY